MVQMTVGRTGSRGSSSMMSGWSSNAGIVLAATLAQRLGIEALVDAAVRLGARPGAANGRGAR